MNYECELKKYNQEVQCLKEHGYSFEESMDWETIDWDAINKIKNNIVINNGFIQFQIQIFNEKNQIRNFIFPCIKNKIIYHYTEAVSLAVYCKEFTYSTPQWISLKSFLYVLPQIESIKHDDIIKVTRIFDFKNKQYYYTIKEEVV